MFVTFLTVGTSVCLRIITVRERLIVVWEAYKKRNQLTVQCMTQNDEMQKWSEKQLHGQHYFLLE